MGKSAIDLKDAYRVLNPGCVVLISTGDGERDNLFAVTWNMPVRKDPPMMALMSSKRHHSWELISKTGEFGVNVMHADHASALLGCGSVSGRTEPDKFARFALNRTPAQLIRAPLVSESVASLECRICQVVDMGASALLIAQIIAGHGDPLHFVDGFWSFDNGLRLLHHLTGPDFAVSSDTVTV